MSWERLSLLYWACYAIYQEKLMTWGWSNTSGEKHPIPYYFLSDIKAEELSEIWHEPSIEKRLSCIRNVSDMAPYLRPLLGRLPIHTYRLGRLYAEMCRCFTFGFFISHSAPNPVYVLSASTKHQRCWIHMHVKPSHCDIPFWQRLQTRIKVIAPFLLVTTERWTHEWGFCVMILRQANS